MKGINPNQLSDIQNYKLLSGSVIPRPIAFVTSEDEKGNLNGAPFSFFNVVNNKPPMIAIAAQRSNGKRKDTAINIEKTKEFVVHITDEFNIEGINETAAPLKYEDNELERTSLTLISSSIIQTPAVKEANIRFECKLDQMIQLGTKNDGADLIIGEVVMYHISEDVYFEDSKIDSNQLKPVARLAGNNYSKLGDIFTIKRPES
ncbi:flavin reductase family protein [Staphylococcus hominis]|uniref:flavin reductase family protein n=1 Tax=Staphylococcus hominis TaxID=1290 RepID=UPI0011A465D7|nr:flavin reductase family protein [Staphylococcus hominis]MCI2897863.1 flavin reductase family protein [Staphylococcus hominis]MDS3874969.1 flavin reductase family protein [Staphylococcus hominis]MDS3901159.1 flavin reductase family protein [Staphylococcus hominis]